jgi:hypothetical protein
MNNIKSFVYKHHVMGYRHIERELHILICILEISLKANNTIASNNIYNCGASNFISQEILFY